VIASVAATAWPAADARACSYGIPSPHVVDPAMQAIDHVPPTLPPLGAPQFTRGKDPQRSGCGYSASSCDDIGSVVIRVGATDDNTPPEQLGFRMSVEAGSLPEGVTLLNGAVKSFGDLLVLNWVDGARDDQEPIEFTLRVVAIDLAGNESAPQTVRVSDDPGGCTIAPARRPSSGLAFVAAAALLLATRRHRGR
jgi:hypothetical protein